MNNEIPRFDEAEKTILSTIFYNDFVGGSLQLIFSKLNEDHFFHPLHKRLFNYLRGLNQEGKEWNNVELMSEAYTNPSKIGSTTDLMEIQQHGSTHSTEQLEKYIEILTLGKTKRTMFEQSIRLQEVAISGDAEEVKQLLSDTEKELAEMATETATTSIVGSARLVLEKIIADWESESQGLTGLSYGNKRIDMITGGMQQGISVFCGLPSDGKSVLMLQACINAIMSGKNVIIFEMDMPDTDVLKRLSCLVSGVDINKFQKSAYREKKDDIEMKKAFRHLRDSENFEIYDTIFDIVEIEAKVEDFKRRRGSVDLIMVDYWQLIETTEKLDETRKMNKTSKALKALTQKHKCPLVTGAQVNAEGDSKDSKQIQADAVFQVIIENTQEPNATGIKIKKNRNGQRNIFLAQRLNGLKQRFEPYCSKSMLEAASVGKIKIPAGMALGDVIQEGIIYNKETHTYS